MAVAFNEEWLGLWVCDDARAVRLYREGAAPRATVTDANGALVGDFAATFEAPDAFRAARAGSIPTDRMGRVCIEVGNGANAQTYTLYFAVRETAPDAAFAYREARTDDPLNTVVIEPVSGASWVEAETSDPWLNPTYGMISWASPLIPYRAAIHRADPHPTCKRPSAYWKLSSSDTPPAPSTGRDEDERTAREWCDLRCVRCGSAGASFVAAADESGTGWRQLYAHLRCERCGRWSQWHYDD